ncbi:MAG: glycosyltransferase family 4 protein [Verrucomicrobia bacterium]|nr:glycosyltransferase family 4 protein [Verrucomicrobiota bacterium]
MHIYLGNNGIFWLPFLRRTTLPVVISFHGADAQAAQSTPRTRETLKEVLKRANRVLARSASLALVLRSAGCSAEKLWIHRTGIPLNYFPFRQRPIPVRGTWKFLQASRLIPKKGLESSIRAFAFFRERWPQAELRIAGQGPLLDSLKSLAESLGIRSYVEFTGFLTQAKLRDLYYDSHFFLHPSVKTSSGDQEGIPNSLLEAMATGLPCIATRHGGIIEAIENESSGLLVSESEPDELAAAMLKLADNTQLYQSIAANGSLVINKQFDLAAQINQLEEIYLQTINDCKH